MGKKESAFIDYFSDTTGIKIGSEIYDDYGLPCTVTKISVSNNEILITCDDGCAYPEYTFKYNDMLIPIDKDGKELLRSNLNKAEGFKKVEPI